MAANINQNGFSKIKEVVASWNEVKQLLRSGEDGNLVPVVIPKEKDKKFSKGVVMSRERPS